MVHARRAYSAHKYPVGGIFVRYTQGRYAVAVQLYERRGYAAAVLLLVLDAQPKG